jgi:hypothetical protein
MTVISCPACGTKHQYDIKSSARPFCSERCQLIDLGAWSQERYRIPVSDEQNPDPYNDLADIH